MNKKRRVLVLTACLALMGVSFGITYAYLTANRTLVNDFTVGENTVEIVEKFEPPSELKPGVDFDKVVQVKNTGTIPCFVRVKVEFSDDRALQFCKLDYQLSSKTWEKGNDGYYYYTQPLPPYQPKAEGGQEEIGITKPLFTMVDMLDEDSGHNKIKEEDLIPFDIFVYTESCEQRGNESYVEAWKRASGEEEQT